MQHIFLIIFYPQVEFFKDIEFVSKCGPADEVELNKVKAKLTARINNLKVDVPLLKEELLTLQAELKINIEEFKRLKFAIIEDFSNYCIYKFHIPSPINQIDEVKHIYHLQLPFIIIEYYYFIEHYR